MKIRSTESGESRFRFFEQGFGLMAAKLGVMPVGYLVKYDLYKTYLEFFYAGNSDEQARKLTMESRNVEYTELCKAIHWFEPDFKRRRGRKGRKLLPEILQITQYRRGLLLK